MSCYTQLTQEERYHISVLCKERFPKAEIARRLNRHLSTITRELKRNTGRRGYRAKQAHQWVSEFIKKNYDKDITGVEIRQKALEWANSFKIQSKQHTKPN